MKKLVKKLLSSVLVVAILFSALGHNVALAQEKTSVYPEYSGENVVMISDYLNEDDIAFMKKLEKIYPFFEFDKNGVLALKVEVSELQKMYNLDDEFIARLNKLLESDIAVNGNSHINNSNLRNFISEYNGEIRPTVHVKNWKVYFTHEEVMDSFFVAAQIGPAAIIAALAGLGTAIGGPVGATIGTIVGYLSGADFMYLVLRSAALKKGVYIGLDWDGPFPVPTQGTW